MKLTSNFPYWLLKNGLTQSYPSLDHDLDCEVIVVGGGITGALVADRLTEEGVEVTVIDRRDICSGSTSASTALLQYEIDVSLVDMKEIIGEEKANRAYKLSHQSIDRLEEIATSLGDDVDFNRRTSIYLASDRKVALELANEARARKLLELDVQYHDADDLLKTFRLNGAAALSSNQAASCDPYKFAERLHKRAKDRGAKHFDRTEVGNYRYEDGVCHLDTTDGFKIKAKHVIYANGFESSEMLKERIVNLDNTYALVSEPLKEIYPWDENWIMWEAKEPYLYMRITSDGRLLVGGEDDEHHSPARRDKVIPKKSAAIEKKVRELLPDLRWKKDYEWAGTFGKTRDGLAYIGKCNEYPGAYFALCFGGNGITFSAIAADMMIQFLKTGDAPNSDLFAFGR